MKIFMDANIIIDLLDPHRPFYEYSSKLYSFCLREKYILFTSCDLMVSDNRYKDLEDTIQYIMAKKEKCNLIISNDKNFASDDIKLMSSEEFCKQYIG